MIWIFGLHNLYSRLLKYLFNFPMLSGLQDDESFHSFDLNFIIVPLYHGRLWKYLCHCKDLKWRQMTQRQVTCYKYDCVLYIHVSFLCLPLILLLCVMNINFCCRLGPDSASA